MTTKKIIKDMLFRRKFFFFELNLLALETIFTTCYLKKKIRIWAFFQFLKFQCYRFCYQNFDLSDGKSNHSLLSKYSNLSRMNFKKIVSKKMIYSVRRLK
jgi:hypothetical protein